MPGRDFIQNPGPTNIPDRVLEAFRRPAVDFAGPEFVALVDSVWADLPLVFGGSHKMIVLTSVGHGAWESALVNTLDPGDEALFTVPGLFAEAWAAMGRDLGYKVATTTTDVRRPTDPDEVHSILAADSDHRIKGVYVVHTETSTGTVTDLAAVRAAIDAAEHPALYVVDAIGSVGSEHIRMGDWGIDVAVTASQKGLMMPPGLGVLALSERAVERSRAVATPRVHYAWEPRLETEYVYQRFGGTPPEQHIYALRAALDMIAEEGGIDAAVGRHHRIAAAVHAAVEGWGTGGPWEINVPDPSHRAAAVSCVRTGEIDSMTLVEAARDRFHVSLGVGVLDMSDHAFRMGHVGDLNEPMILGALGGIETAMTALGMPHGEGLPAAVASLAASA